MEKKVFKIGQEVEIAKDFTIETLLSETKIEVKAGSKAYVSADGCINYISGSARGRRQELDTKAFEIKGFDHENIAKMIYKKIARYMEIDSMLDDYDIDKEYLTEVIEEAIREIL